MSIAPDLSRDGLARLAEASIADREPGWRDEPYWEVVERPDLLMWSGPLPDRTSNEVIRATWSEGEAAERVGEVVRWFEERDRACRWMVGPSSGPADLGRILGSHGLRRTREAHLLTVRLPMIDVPQDPEIEVREVHDEAGIHDLILVQDRGWTPEQIERAIDERLRYLHRPDRRGGYAVGYVNGQPAGYGLWRISADGLCLYFKGAGTLPAFRRHGVFTTLLAYRASIGFERGCRYAAGVAYANTSAPIAIRYGFEDQGHVPIYETSDGHGPGPASPA